MKSNILILPASEWVVPLIRKAKELGHNVFVVNPYEDSPGFKYADDHLLSDIFDYDKVIQYAKDNNVNAIISDECDIAMPAIAKYGNLLGLPALSEETAIVFQDKFAMRDYSKKHGIKYPEYRLCTKEEEAIELLESIKKPLIIKPLDNCSSRGVFKVSTPEEIREHFQESLSFSHFHKAVLAERFINGKEFTIDTVKTPSKNYTLAISEKGHFKHNLNIADELLFSHFNPNYDYDKLRATNDNYIMQSGLQFGFTHAEYKYEDGDFYLIEIGARGGGNMISSCITQFMSGYDTYRYLIDCATGHIHDEDFSIRPDYRDRASVLKFFSTPNGGGKVTAIEGLDYLENEKDIAHYRFNFKVGDTIQNALNDAARIGFYIATCENMARLRQVMSDVKKNVKIIVE